jgi:hypothetical protein
MPLDAQPPDRRGTVGHPYTALNLRLVLAIFGLVASAVLGLLVFRAGLPVLGWALVGLAVVAVVDLVVIALRLRARRRAGEDTSSLFE